MAGTNSRKRHIRKHDFRTDDQKALAVAMSEKMGIVKAAELLGWPETTIRLYCKQAKEERSDDFGPLCRSKADELGAMGYDLSGGALRRLGERLERNELSERGLLSLAGLGWNLGKEAFNHGPQAQSAGAVTVNVSVDGAGVLGSLAAIAERLGGAEEAGEGPMIEARVLVEGAGEE